MPNLLKRLARLWPYVRASRMGLVAAGLAAVVTAATEPMIAELLRLLLDKGFKPDGLPLWMVPVAFIGLFVVRSLAGFVAQYGLAWTAQRALLAVRKRLFDWLQKCAPSLLSQHSASAMTNTLVYEAQTGMSLLAGSLLTLVRDSLILIALLIYLLTLNWQLTLIVGLLFPAVAVIMRVLGRRLHQLTIQGQKATDELAYVVEENMLTWRIVRLFGAQPAQQQRFVGKADAVRRLMLKAVVAGASMTPVTQILAACALSVVIMIAMAQGRSGATTVGEFVAFVTAMLQLVAPAKHLSDVVAPLTRGLAAVERGLNLIDQGEVEQGGSYGASSCFGSCFGSGTSSGFSSGAGSEAGSEVGVEAGKEARTVVSHEASTGAKANNGATVQPTRAHGDIVFESVSLRYKEDSAPALDQFSLHVRAGETVALVGPSGAGKSTLVNLLPRFIEASSGRILLDGVALADWDLLALRRQLALVSQDVVLFNDTVAHNVSLGAQISREAIRDALRAAHLLEFVDALPQGMDTWVGHNGSELSGGQRQRLAIARAIIKDAPVLILDEATSALDSESERAVQDALDQLMQGRTTLVIAHRLSTIEHADRVVALEGGRMVQAGTHAELLAKGGVYARLHAMQFSTG